MIHAVGDFFFKSEPVKWSPCKMIHWKMIHRIFQSWTCKMIHYSVFSQSQPVKWHKMLRFCVFLRVIHVAFCARSAQKIFRGFQGLTRFWYHFRAKREENCWRFQAQNEVFITWQCFLAVTFWGSRKVSALVLTLLLFKTLPNTTLQAENDKVSFWL